jgi:polyhydroxyalkanoate synthesis regulator phasin
MPNEYANIKHTSEYRQAKAEVDAMIKHAVTPLQSKLDEMTAVVVKLEKTVADLEARLPKQ